MQALFCRSLDIIQLKNATKNGSICCHRRSKEFLGRVKESPGDGKNEGGNSDCHVSNATGLQMVLDREHVSGVGRNL